MLHFYTNWKQLMKTVGLEYAVYFKLKGVGANWEGNLQIVPIKYDENLREYIYGKRFTKKLKSLLKNRKQGIYVKREMSKEISVIQYRLYLAFSEKEQKHIHEEQRHKSNLDLAFDYVAKNGKYFYDNIRNNGIVKHDRFGNKNYVVQFETIEDFENIINYYSVEMEKYFQIKNITMNLIEIKNYLNVRFMKKQQDVLLYLNINEMNK